MDINKENGSENGERSTEDDDFQEKLKQYFPIDPNLIGAVVEGDLELLKQLILKIESSNIMFSAQSELIYRAIIANQAAILDFLLSLSTYTPLVNYDNKFKEYALLLAVQFASPLIKRLLVKNVDVNCEYGAKETLLHYAAVLHDNPDIARLLIENGANLDARDWEGMTALHRAVQYPDTVKLLIENGADVNIKTFNAETPLHLALIYPETVHLLIKNGAELDARDDMGRTPLYEAVYWNNLESVCMLLFYNADPNIGDIYEVTPFMKAIINRNIEIQNVLLEYVTDFNAAVKWNFKQTALSLAVQFSSPHVQELINRGADVNKFTCELCNPFLVCLQYTKNIEVFKTFWPKFKFQPLYQDIPYLEAMIYYLNEPLLIAQFLRVIIDSGNVSPIFNNFNVTCVDYKYEYLQPMWDYVQQIDPQLISELVCLYLCEGNVLRDDVICRIYRLFGYCELLRICLHMDIEITDYSYNNIDMAILLYDPLLSIDTMKKWMFKCGELVDCSSFLPHLRVATFCKNSSLQDLRGMSSLKELARNSTRDHLILKFSLDTSKKYHLFVQNMIICTVYKDMLTFKKPIYVT